MAGLRVHLEHGPETHLANVNLVGGQVVAPDGVTGRVRAATGTDTTILGVAQGDAAAFATAGALASTTDAWGRHASGGLTPPNEVAVVYRGSWWLKNTSGATWAYGQRLYVGANGILTGTPSTSGVVVGICIDPAGVANTAEGRVRVTIR